MISLNIIDIANKQKLKEFIFLPETIHKNNTNYLPPIWSDECDFYNPTKNRALANSDYILVMAYDAGKPVGRIMGIVPHFYNQLKNENIARFYALECYENPEIAKALINFIENWAKEKNISKLIGPYGFSDKDPQGAQIQGFEYMTVIATPNNSSYLPKLIELNGYTKSFDCVTYKLPIPDHFPEKYQLIFNRILKNSKLKLMEFESKKALKPYIIPVLELVNITYEPLFGFVPMTPPEMKKFAAQYLPILDPKFVKVIVDNKNTPVAFAIGMPNLSQGIKKAKGRLFPFGFIHILLAGRYTKQMDLLLGAVHPNYRGRGLTMQLANGLFETAKSKGLEFIDSHLILESNSSMRAEFEKMGGEIYKRYRIFEKQLN
jgi:GNAT superfamily N-acetyltransferase